MSDLPEIQGHRAAGHEILAAHSRGPGLATVGTLTGSLLARTETSPVERTIGRLLGQDGGRVGALIFVGLVLLGVLAPVLAPYDPLRIGAGDPFAGPTPAHWFGTDDLGRDILSRVIYGARISLTVSVASAALALALALPLGTAAGYVGGTTDAVITRVFDTIFAFPSILLGIGLVAVLGSSTANVIIAVGLISIPTLGRVTRVGVLGQRAAEYVEAARAVGSTHWGIMARHILPNVVPVLLVQITLVMSDAVLLEAAFSFLGLGSRPPTPSWGTMLDEGRQYLSRGPWLGLFPGITITTMILGLNALGDALRTALDPHSR